MERGFAWLDTGTPESLIEAGQFIHTVEKRQGIKVACLEEIAFENGWINHDQLLKSVKDMYQTEYRQYLLDRYKNSSNDNYPDSISRSTIYKNPKIGG